MKKWNNVYFYSYNAYGTLIKNKVINIVEGTESDHNLTIYPVTGEGRFAATGSIESSKTFVCNVRGSKAQRFAISHEQFPMMFSFFSGITQPVYIL